MSHLLTDLTPVARTEVVAAIREKIEETARQRTRSAKVTRISLRVENDRPLSLLQWLAAHNLGYSGHEPKFFWSDRDRRRETAAIGAADVIAAGSPDNLPDLFDRLDSGLRHQPDTIRYFGGFRFDLTQSLPPEGSPWGGFPAATFVLPRFELVRYGDSLLFACNLCEQDWRENSLSKILASLEKLTFTDSPVEVAAPSLIERHDLPNREAWLEILKSAGGLLKQGDLEKIVLARRSSLTFRDPLCPWTLLDHLRTSGDRCYLFGLQLGKDAAFIGSSPERLYVRDGVRLQTEAIAGTRARGDSPEEDARLAEDLRSSEKDAREHQFVINGIIEALDTLGVHSKQDASPTLLSLARVHHLSCRIIGKLNEGVTDRDLITALHPTPAVGGYPSRAAVPRIRTLEPFDRGWYAGPIGWFGRDDAEFAVGIRSALVAGAALHLFAGAGIVSGSDPDSEWREVETKISRFISVVSRA